MEPEQVRQFVSKAARCNARAAFEILRTGDRIAAMPRSSHATASDLLEAFSVRKATLGSVLAKAGPGIRTRGRRRPDRLRHACKLGLEGIVQAEGLHLPLRPVTGLD
jgi:hypothetical protein